MQRLQITDRGELERSLRAELFLLLKHSPAIAMDIAHGSADLLVTVLCDVFLQEIEQNSVTLLQTPPQISRMITSHPDWSDTYRTRPKRC